MPAGVTDVSLKVYRATAVGTGSTAATQDLLTGVLYGPNIDLTGNNTLGEGMVPGLEAVGILDDATGR